MGLQRVCFGFYGFTGRSARPTVSDGHIFLCLKKDMEERQTKGLRSRPLESGFFIRGLGGETCLPDYVFARVQLTRFRPVRGVLRTASTDSIILLRLRRMRNTHRITNLICSRKLGGCVSLSIFLGTAVRRAHGSSALVYAMRDLIASNAPLREESHKARPASSKTLTPGIQGAAAPWHAFLPYLSSCNERWGPRRASVK